MNTLKHLLVMSIANAALMAFAAPEQPGVPPLPVADLKHAPGPLNMGEAEITQRTTTNALLAVQTGSPARSTNQSPPVLTRADMEADLEHLTVRLKRAWAYAEDKRAWLGVDIDTLHAAARRELDQVHDADGFYLLVKTYVAGLMDGHAGVRAGHQSPGLSTPFRWPFSVTRMEGHFYVKAVDAQDSLLRPGDELLTVNGLTLSNKFAATLTHSTGSTPAGREYRALGAMRRGPEKRLRVEALRGSSQRITCELEAVGSDAAQGQAEEPIRWRRLEKGVGYLRFPSFAQDMKIWEQGGRSPTALQQALESKKSALRDAFANLSETRALIVDLRGNLGGSDALGHFLAHCLCDTQAQPIYYTLATRMSEDLLALPDFAARAKQPKLTDDERSNIQLLPEKNVQRYRGKLVVLMDEGCFSACDCFLNYLSVAAPETTFRGTAQRCGRRRAPSRRNPAAQQDGRHVLRDASLEPQR